MSAPEPTKAAPKPTTKAAPKPTTKAARKPTNAVVLHDRYVPIGARLAGPGEIVELDQADAKALEADGFIAIITSANAADREAAQALKRRERDERERAAAESKQAREREAAQFAAAREQAGELEAEQRAVRARREAKSRAHHEPGARFVD